MVWCGGDRLATLSAAPLGCPHRSRLGAVSVPALMCHVSGGASRGPLLGALPNCLWRQSGPPSQALPRSPTPAPKVWLWGRIRDNWMEPSAAPAGHREGQHRCRPPPLSSHAGAMRQPAGQALCHNGQNQLCGSSLDLSSPSTQAQDRTAGWEPHRCLLSQRGSSGVAAQALSVPGHLNELFKPKLLSQHRSLHGLITRPPRPLGPLTSRVTFGWTLAQEIAGVRPWYNRQLQSGAERGGKS